MLGRRVLLAGILLLGAADLVVLDLVAAPAWLASASPAKSTPGEGTSAPRPTAPSRLPSTAQPSPPAPPPASGQASAAGSFSPTLEPPAPAASSAPVAAASGTPAPATAEGSATPAVANAPKLPRLIFQQGSAVLTPVSVESLMRASRYLKSHPDVALAIHGHAWDGDDPEQNRAIGDKRAAVTADFLAAVGVDRSRLRTVGHGATQPADRNDNPDASARNRRVELVWESRGSDR